jgi:hypothetical protein
MYLSSPRSQAFVTSRPCSTWASREGSSSCSIFSFGTKSVLQGSEIKVRGKYSVNRVFRGLADNYSNTSLISLSSSSLRTVFMSLDTTQELLLFSICFEGFLYGNISVLCVPLLLVAIISCAVAYQYTIASLATSNRVTAIVKSYQRCPRHSRRWLWLHLPMYPSTHKSLYLSSVLFS